MDTTTTEQLFRRIEALADLTAATPDVRNKNLHAVLVQVCYEGVRDTQMAFGNLFAQIDYLCRAHGVGVADTVAIQTMRRHSNSSEAIADADWRYDLRALALLVSAVGSEPVPPYLVGRIPVAGRRPAGHQAVNRRYLRCVVSRADDHYIYADTDHDSTEPTVRVAYGAHEYLRSLLRRGTQLNLLDCHGDDPLEPSLIVLEPDYLVDISAIARCFTDYGHHPLSYTVNRLASAANSQAILLGNFAGRALDDIINHADDYDWHDTLRASFRERAMEYCTCPDFNSHDDFKTAALRQVDNLRGIVSHLFGPDGAGERRQGYDRSRAILEPSFVCEQLGIQGRVDLMTTDLRLLVEQKSGANYNIQSGHPNRYGSYQKEDHYVQLLLYAGVLRYNFDRRHSQTDLRLLYSKYPLPGGLVSVNYYQALFYEAIAFRNRIVAQEYAYARQGFGPVIDRLTPETLNERQISGRFYTDYIYRQQQQLLGPLHALSPVARAYLAAMATFVYREQLAAKVGVHEGVGTSMADLWNMPLATKREMGNIYTGLTIMSKERSSGRGGYDTITLRVPDQGADFLPNFRTGDMVYLYAYQGEPDVRRALLFKGSLTDIHTHRITLHLNDGQQNPQILAEGTYAVEHGGSDSTFTAQLRSLRELVSSSGPRLDLLLGQRQPTADASRQLTRSYSPAYDDILLKAKRANDFFLLVGPPGTGKTSMALRFMVEEALTDASASLLLMSYTNRAVDEICAMLDEAAIDYLRIGGAYTCDARFRPHLLDSRLGATPRLDHVRHTLAAARVVVATTSTLQSRAYLFELRQFSLAIVDEASQILEPSVVGLLARVPRFILVGDYKQLPAVVQQPAALSRVDDPLLRDMGLYDCRDSLFERLYRREMAQGRTDFVGILRRQGRMHPDVAEFPNRMFYRREQLQCVPLPHQGESFIYPQDVAVPADDALGRLMHTHRNLFLASATNVAPTQSDKVNPAEAQVVARLLGRIYRYYGAHFDAAHTVGVIVPYRNQIAMIRHCLEATGIEALGHVTIDTVERYQGSQRDIIIYSFTIQHAYQLDFLTANCFEEDGHVIDRKLNVALTRARKQLILTGHEPTLRHNALFARLVDHVTIHGGYVPAEGEAASLKIPRGGSHDQ